MSRTDYAWSAALPPKPNVYMTRRNASKVHSIRYWDGERWHDIGITRTLRRDAAGRITRAAAKPFKWPKGSGIRRPAWMRQYREQIGLRNISDQSPIQWGTPFEVYDEKEVLDYLVACGRLPCNWRQAYQGEMRANFAVLKGATK